MDTNTIVQQTKDFYKNISNQFSNTRKYSWKGWEGVFGNIEIKDDYSILDIACGNGRFVNFLLKNNSNKNIKYLGLDYDDNLLDVAKNNYSDLENIEFKKLDVINNINSINNTFDIVVAFGITHHIPNNEFRIKWFEIISHLVANNGYLIFSNWNFLNKTSTTKAKELQDNDYWVGWGSTNEKRYCHYYDKNETKKILDMLKNNNMNIIKKFEENDDLNNYYILQKKIK